MKWEKGAIRIGVSYKITFQSGFFFLFLILYHLSGLQFVITTAIIMAFAFSVLAASISWRVVGKSGLSCVTRPFFSLDIYSSSFSRSLLSFRLCTSSTQWIGLRNKRQIENEFGWGGQRGKG